MRPGQRLLLTVNYLLPGTLRVCTSVPFIMLVIWGSLGGGELSILGGKLRRQGGSFLSPLLDETLVEIIAVMRAVA